MNPSLTIAVLAAAGVALVVQILLMVRISLAGLLVLGAFLIARWSF
ncbi:hypothetical protein J4G37_24280 [Microvirga sp. 3-52]|jgi:hypothetical protein|nr:hypothetical protein [Microvirga sp. 3-52]